MIYGTHVISAREAHRDQTPGGTDYIRTIVLVDVDPTLAGNVLRSAIDAAEAAVEGWAERSQVIWQTHAGDDIDRIEVEVNSVSEH